MTTPSSPPSRDNIRHGSGPFKILPNTRPILVVIDLQKGLVSGLPDEGPCSTPNLIPNVSQLLKTWRTQTWPIIHIHHDDLDPSHPLHRAAHPDRFVAHACSKPLDSETLLHKHLGSAFVDSELDLENRLRILQGGADSGVVMIGMDGAQCISDNARAANDLGFPVTVVADACASYGMRDWRDQDRQIGAEEVHGMAMSMLANGFARVVTLDELLKECEAL